MLFVYKPKTILKPMLQIFLIKFDKKFSLNIYNNVCINFAQIAQICIHIYGSTSTKGLSYR